MTANIRFSWFTISILVRIPKGLKDLTENVFHVAKLTMINKMSNAIQWSLSHQHVRVLAVKF